MEEYLRLEEEKAQSHERTFNWQTATYRKMRYYEDEDDRFTNFKTEFPAIVLDETSMSDAALSWEPTVSPLNNNEIDFRISFDKSDDEDYTVIFDENSFSYKIYSVNNLKTDSKNENDKVKMPSSPSPEPRVSYFDNLVLFNDFKNEFPAITYNDDLTSKLDPLTDPSMSSQHIDDFNLKNETSLSEYDKEKQNILYFNYSFLLNVISPNDLKTDKDNDNAINMTQISRNNIITIDTKGSDKLLETSHDRIRKIFNIRSFIIELNVNIMTWNCINNWMPLIPVKNLYVPFGIPFDPKWYYKDGVYTRILRRPRDQRHLWLRYQVEGYTKDIVHNYEQRLEMIFGRVQAPKKAWVPRGLERQQVAVAGALEATKDAHVVDEDALVVPALVQVPQLPPSVTGPTRTIPQRIVRLEEEDRIKPGNKFSNIAP
uniref:Uncharacterized protein n=1 Tax=Tanacetum cinerariifolium TaxID=118510 RepID=A0A6L2K1Z1_TANCI|nr:hypothetical protein [Tanacetum cinerariifolium]